MVDAADLKSVSPSECGFKSHLGHSLALSSNYLQSHYQCNVQVFIHFRSVDIFLVLSCIKKCEFAKKLPVN